MFGERRTRHACARRPPWRLCLEKLNVFDAVASEWSAKTYSHLAETTVFTMLLQGFAEIG
jgi:hypothetical protein